MEADGKQGLSLGFSGRVAGGAAAANDRRAMEGCKGWLDLLSISLGDCLSRPRARCDNYIIEDAAPGFSL